MVRVHEQRPDIAVRGVADSEGHNLFSRLDDPATTKPLNDLSRLPFRDDGRTETILPDRHADAMNGRNVLSTRLSQHGLRSLTSSTPTGQIRRDGRGSQHQDHGTRES